MVSRLLLCLAIFSSLSALGRAASDWFPVSPADLAATQSPIDPSWDAEILQRRTVVRVSVLESGGFNSGQTREETYSENFVTVKVYTEAGVNQNEYFGIRLPVDSKAQGIQARILKPGGEIVTLQKSDFIENTVKQQGGSKYKLINFTLSQLKPGDVLQYRYDIQEFENARYMWFFCQEYLPIRKYSFRLEADGTRREIFWLNAPTLKKASTGGGLELTMENLPAHRDEPQMPSRRDTNSWIGLVVSYVGIKQADIWNYVNTSSEEDFSMRTKPNGAIKELAAQLTKGTNTDDEKWHALYDYCRDEIGNLSYTSDPELMSVKAKRDSKDEWQTARETLAKKNGYSTEVDELFAALLRGAGFAPSLLRYASRTDTTLVRSPYGWSFLDERMIALKTESSVVYFHPGNPWLPYGMLPKGAERITGLVVCDSKKLGFAYVPASAPERNGTTRIATLALDDEGTLSGTVEETIEGLAALRLKYDRADTSDKEISNQWIDDFTQRLPGAEVSQIEFTNLTGRRYPVVVKYQLRIPNYAETAGDRLVLRPSVFGVAAKPLFTSGNRIYPVTFDYASRLLDKIEITLPAGYQLDAPSAPKPVSKPEDPFRSTYALRFDKKRHALRLQREVVIGTEKALDLTKESYSAIKGIFDEMARSDSHSILLKPKTEDGSAP